MIRELVYILTPQMTFHQLTTNTTMCTRIKSLLDQLPKVSPPLITEVELLPFNDPEQLPIIYREEEYTPMENE